MDVATFHSGFINKHLPNSFCSQPSPSSVASESSVDGVCRLDTTSFESFGGDIVNIDATEVSHQVISTSCVDHAELVRPDESFLVDSNVGEIRNSFPLCDSINSAAVNTTLPSSPNVMEIFSEPELGAPPQINSSDHTQNKDLLVEKCHFHVTVPNHCPADTLSSVFPDRLHLTLSNSLPFESPISLLTFENEIDNGETLLTSQVTPDTSKQFVSPINMLEQEAFKAERKRVRNRVAASKCRKRKLERISRLEEKVTTLKIKNQELSTNASLLRKQVADLKMKVLSHVKSGCRLMMSQQQIIF